MTFPPPARCLPVLLLLLPLFSARAQDGDPAPSFEVRTAAGKLLRGPLRKVGPGWAVEVGRGVRRKVPAGELVSLRREGRALPPLPSDEHLLLVGGDRVPVRDPRLDDEKLLFRHPDLDGGRETALPLAS